MYSVARIKTPADSAMDLIRREYPHYHPLIALARMAHSPAVTADAHLELEVHKAILPYVAPKLSSVEHKIENPEDRRIIVSLFEERTLENGSIVEVEVPLITEINELVRLD